MSHTLTEGGQITSHRLRMFKQVMKVAFFGSFIIGGCFFLIQISSVPQIAYLSLWYYFKTWMLQDFFKTIEVSKDYMLQVANVHYNQNPYLSSEYVLKLSSYIIKKFSNELYLSFAKSILVSGLSFFAILGFFFYRGKISKNKQHLSGSKIISPRWLKFRIKLSRKASPIKIGPIPLIKGTENQHIMITGGTGSGKTNCLHYLLHQIRSNKQKAIVIDTTGVFLNSYFREDRDILLNPFNPISKNWSPWAEGSNAIEFSELAESFIPSTLSENENYWRLASKAIFISLLQKFSDTKKTSEIVRWIQYESLPNLCKLVEGTKAAAHMDLSSEKTASSVRSVASTFLECLETLKDCSNPFSIREWLTQNDDSWLFLQCMPTQRAILKPLMSAWISSAVRGLLHLPIDLNRKIWFVIDELPSLQRIKDLETLLTEGRKYGGCGVISLQSPAQLETIYGRESTKTIIGNTGTKLIFQERDPEIAARISRAFGEREVLEIQEGISYGAHEARDGVNLSMQNRIRPVVSTTQILSLPTNSAFVKLAGENDITQIKLKIHRNR